MNSIQARHLYIFLDEAGNLDFSVSGTRYFVLASVTKERPFHAYQELTELKYDLVEQGVDLEYFHATEDKQKTRDQVFDIIQRNLEGIHVDALVVEKRKTAPSLQADEKFYPRMVGYQIKYILDKHPLDQFSEVVVFTDSLPVQKKRKAIEKAVKLTLATMLPSHVRYRVLHHSSKSNMDLQIADYCTWAIYRKWANQDDRSSRLIQTAIRSEFDIFQTGTTLYY